MILEIVTGDISKLIIQLYVVFITWAIVVLAIGIDLYFGIQKSKKGGIYTHSYGLRQTSKKTVQYLALMAFFLFIDVLNPFWIYFKYQPMPLFSIFGAIVLTYTEYKSVREKSDKKFRSEFENNTKEILKFIKDNKEFFKDITKNKQQDETN